MNMVVFGVRLFQDDNIIPAAKFMIQTNERLQSNNIVLNPFRGGIKDYEPKEKDGKVIVDYAVFMKPVYPCFPLFFLLLAIGIYVITSTNWVFWFFLALSSLGILWTRYFFYVMLRLGLRKANYYGKVKLLSAAQVMEEHHGPE